MVFTFPVNIFFLCNIYFNIYADIQGERILIVRIGQLELIFSMLLSLPPFIFPQGGKVLLLLPPRGKAGKGVSNENAELNLMH